MILLRIKTVNTSLVVVELVVEEKTYRTHCDQLLKTNIS